jgi:hypothetical protein
MDRVMQLHNLEQAERRVESGAEALRIRAEMALRNSVPGR